MNVNKRRGFILHCVSSTGICFVCAKCRYKSGLIYGRGAGATAGLILWMGGRGYNERVFDLLLVGNPPQILKSLLTALVSKNSEKLKKTPKKQEAYTNFENCIYLFSSMSSIEKKSFVSGLYSTES